MATVQALGARSHVLTLAGEVGQAYAALHEQARAFDRLPDQITSDLLSAGGWPVFRLLYCRSLVYTLAGHTDADQAQREAISSYPSARVRQRAQVELHRAHTEVQQGHIDDGLGHAREVLARVGAANMTRFVLHVAAGVADAVPVAERSRPSMIEYRQQIALTAGGGT